MIAMFILGKRSVFWLFGGLLCACICSCDSSLNEDEKAAKKLGYDQFLPYDNSAEKAAFFQQKNQERAREYAVVRIQAALLGEVSSVAELEQLLTANFAWLDELLGTVEEPLLDSEKRIDLWLQGELLVEQEQDAAVEILASLLVDQAEELGWNPEKIDNTATALRQVFQELELLLEQAKQEAEETDVLAELAQICADKVAEYPFAEQFRRVSKAELPQNLQEAENWATNWDEPELGSEEAIKGGTFHRSIPEYPATLRRYGPGAGNSFRGYHFDNIELQCTEFHPNTGELIPSLCDRWFISEDNRTVYFHIDDRATWSDGEPVLAEDFFTAFYVAMTPLSQSPFYRQYFSQQFTNVSIYDDKTFSITLRHPSPRELATFNAGVYPCPTKFYQELSADYPERYQWRPSPTTGAYMIDPKDIELNRSITLTRVKNWWRKDVKYSKNRYNADQIAYHLVRDSGKNWELFRIGSIDFVYLLLPSAWYDRSEVSEVWDGYVERSVFFNVYPRTPWGLYLNTAMPPLDNRNVREGIAYACDWDGVIEQEFRGDASRLEMFAQGYPLVPTSPITARRFDPEKAREHFALAGYTERGSGGILQTPEGERLQVTILIRPQAVWQRMMRRLVERARLAGLELIIDVRDSTDAFREIRGKRHQITYSGWGFQPPLPDFYQYLHSSNAREPDGSLKKNTNNIFSWSDSETDRLAEQARNAQNLDEVIDAIHKLNQIVHDEALFIPAYMQDFARQGYWRWVCWPDDFSLKSFYIPDESFVWWIDEEKKRETLEAKNAGRTFSEVLEVHDQYREKAADSVDDSLEQEDLDHVLETEPARTKSAQLEPIS